MNIPGLIDEYESARIAVAALAEALGRAIRIDDRFAVPGLRIALDEADTALANLSIELMDAIESRLQEAA